MMHCKPIPVIETGFSLRSSSHREKPVSITGNPVLIAGMLFSLQGFPCKPLYFPVVHCSALRPMPLHFLTHIILTTGGVFYLSYMHLEMYNVNFWWILQFLNGLLGCNFGNSQENKSKYYPKSRPTHSMLRVDYYTIFGPIQKTTTA